MKSINIILGIVLFSIITLLTPSCIPTGGGTPTPVVSDSLAIGEYYQTNSISTSLGTTFDGGTVQINANNSVYILLKQSIPGQFPYFYDFVGTYTKTGNTINFTVNYTGSISIPSPSRTINGSLSLITNVVPNKVRLTFNTTLPMFPATNGNFVFEK